MTVLLEIFFTLPKLNEGSSGAIVQWITDPRLRRHVKELIQQEVQATEEALAQVFLNTLKQEPGDRLNELHLVAFLSRFGYKAAWQARNDIRNIGRLASDSNAQFKDLLQIAFEASSMPVTFFKNFTLERANDVFWYAALKKYCHGKMIGILRDKVRLEKGSMETFKRSDLGLAARTSKKEVTEALKHAGESETLSKKNQNEVAKNAEQTTNPLDRYLLAWECFKEVKLAGGINISSPKPEQFQEIANRYNFLSSGNHPIIDGNTVEKWLKYIGKAIREYVDKRINSLDAPRNDEESPSLVEGLADDSTVIEWGTLSASEVSAAAQQVKNFLYNLFKDLDDHTQVILLLAHGLKLSQNETANELGINNQSAVSRSCKKIMTDLLQQLGAWVQEHQGIGLSSEILNSIKGHLEEQLEEYYASSINQWFEEVLFALDRQSQEILQRRYAVNQDETTIAIQLQVPTEKVSEVLANMKESVPLAIAERLNSITKLPFKPEGKAATKLLEMWEQWLKTAAYTGKN